MSTASQGILENKAQFYSAYLTKPIKQSILLETIFYLLESKLEPVKAKEFGAQEVSLASKHLNILIAHDNDLTRAVTEKNLSMMGHKCVSVNSADQIIEYAGKRNFDLMFVDTGLADSSGIEAVKKLRRITSEDKMPLVIALSENASQEKKKLINAGMDDVMHRDMDSDTIQKAIEEWFD
jgi:CheY-like chemotaxis protein